MRIRVAVPDGLSDDEQKAVIDSALETVATAAEPLVAHGRVPTAAQAIGAGRVRWRPEPPGDEHFDPPGLVMGRGWGDCDDLAPWHAASLRVTGEDPQAFPFVYRSGPTRWHAVVQRSDGSIDDPSRAAGMGKRGEVSGVGPSLLWRPMFQYEDGTPRLGIASHPWNGGHVARVDAPVGELPVAYSVTYASRRAPRNAVVGALTGAMGLVDPIDQLTALRLLALRELLSGTHPQVVGEALVDDGWDPDQVGDLLGDLLPAAGSLAGGAFGGPLGAMLGGGLGKAAGGLLGGMMGGGKGGGGGGAAAAPAGAGPAVSAPGMISPGGMSPGTTLMDPRGPIIVRF